MDTSGQLPPLTRLSVCPLFGDGHGRLLCHLSPLWRAVFAAIVQLLDNLRLSQAVERGAGDRFLGAALQRGVRWVACLSAIGKST